MTDDYFSVSIDSWGDGIDSVPSEDLFDLCDLLEEVGALGPVTSIGGIAGGVGATFGVDARDPSEAASKSSELFLMACERLGMPHRGVARMDILSESYLELDLAQEPERYVGAAEVAQLFGVSRQRIWQLRTTRDDFPAPLAELASGPIWKESSFGTFLDGWDRRSGRHKGATDVT